MYIWHCDNLFFTGINTFVRVTVDVFQSFTAVNCFFFEKYNQYISCEVEYSQDCNILIQKKRNGASINESDVTILLNDVAPSIQYCFVVTAKNQTYTVKLQGKFTGELNIYRDLWTQKHSIPGYRAESILNTSIITSVIILVALVSLITLTAIVIVCYKKKKSSKGNEPVEPVYYSAVKPVAEEVTADPTYDEISAAVKTWKDIAMKPNEAYHPMLVQPNEAYQTNIIVN